MMAAWKDVKGLFQNLLCEGGALFDDDELARLAVLQKALLDLENFRPIDEMLKKLEDRTRILVELADSRGRVVLAQGVGIERLRQAVLVLEKRCDDVEKALQVVASASAGNFGPVKGGE